MLAAVFFLERLISNFEQQKTSFYGTPTEEDEM